MCTYLTKKVADESLQYGNELPMHVTATNSCCELIVASPTTRPHTNRLLYLMVRDQQSQKERC